MDFLLNNELKLPNGVIVKNRLAKAAMTERRATSNHNPNQYHLNLYQTWAEGKPGILITGNIMIDRKSFESAGNVVVEDERALEKLTQWAEKAKANGSLFIGQISHPGRQTARTINGSPVSASAIKLKQQGLYGKPRALNEKEIPQFIERYANTAVILQKAGFDGVQIHGAHGYLISQFLSPLTNIRQDSWGGSLENRARFLIEIVKAVNNRTKSNDAKFTVSVKLNSADFQRGGFNEEDSLKVISLLAKENIDFLEISGGNYENPSFFMHDKVRESTIKREAYFIDFAKKVRKVTNLPLMITGGFRSLDFIEQVLANKEADLIGIARPFLTSRTFAQDFLNREVTRANIPEISTGYHRVDLLAQAGWFDIQMQRLAKLRKPDLNVGAYRAVFHILNLETIKSLAHRLCSKT